ncbi:MAG: CDP-alcohol phosphatidyltransferase family protein [Clostridia bacterium]|nr:CDP-alcohol phosphatidyltransferase family protein [Clostridia bacterium]
MATFEKKNIPNIISVFRIVLVPLYVLLFFGVIPWGEPLISSGIVFIVAGISDLADGYLARRNNWITDVGKLLDPLADKLLELAVTLCIAIRFGNAFILLAAITVIKEGVMIVGAFIILRHGKFAVSSVWYGKAATFAWFLTVLIMSFIPSAVAWGQYLCIALIGFMAFAFIMYVIHFKDVIAKTWKELHKDKGAKASMTEAEETK